MSAAQEEQPLKKWSFRSRGVSADGKTKLKFTGHCIGRTAWEACQDATAAIQKLAPGYVEKGTVAGKCTAFPTVRELKTKPTRTRPHGT